MHRHTRRLHVHTHAHINARWHALTNKHPAVTPRQHIVNIKHLNTNPNTHSEYKHHINLIDNYVAAVVKVDRNALELRSSSSRFLTLAFRL